MKPKRIISLILIIAGIGLIGTSVYINSEVTKGKSKVARAQGQVNQGNSLFSLSPATKDIGQEITGSAQKKINEGVQQITHYEGVARVCQLSGIVILLLGAGFFFLGNKKSR